MSFDAQQVSALSADLDRKHVSQRAQAGRQLSYVEGWHVIAEANRIFGFDGWSSETVSMQLASEGERPSNSGAKLFTCTYTARCRVTVFAGDRVIVREGVGAGHGMDRDAGQAHEKATKEAETDARKRALMTFGNQFGLALYDKTQANVSDGAEDEPVRRGTVAAQPAPTAQANGAPMPEVDAERTAPEAPVDPKIAALNKPKGPTRNDSASVRKLILLALDFCDSMDSLTEFGKANGRQSPRWPLMLPEDQKAVLRACEAKLKEVRAAAAKAAKADPETGEVAA